MAPRSLKTAGPLFLKIPHQDHFTPCNTWASPLGAISKRLILAWFLHFSSKLEMFTPVLLTLAQPDAASFPPDCSSPKNYWRSWVECNVVGLFSSNNRSKQGKFTCLRRSASPPLSLRVGTTPRKCITMAGAWWGPKRGSPFSPGTQLAPSQEWEAKLPTYGLFPNKWCSI